MSDQYLNSEGGSPFHEGHGGQVIDNRDAGIAELPLPEAENESTYFTDFGNTSGQIPSFGDESSFTGNDSGHLFDIPDSWIPSSQPEYHTNFSMDFSVSGLNPPLQENLSFTNFSMDFNGSGLNLPFEGNLSFANFSMDFDRFGLNPPLEGNSSFTNFSTDFSGSGLNPQLEGNSSFTENLGGSLDAAATPNCEEYDETRDSPDLSNSVQNYHFGDGWSFSAGAGEQFSDASGAEILDNAAYKAKAPLYPDMMPQSAVGPQSGYNWQDAPQSGDNYNIGPSDSDQPNASPLQPRDHRHTQSGDDYNNGPSDPDQSNESPQQPQKKMQRWTEKEEIQLLRGVENRVPLKKIGEDLNRTANSCRIHHNTLVKKALKPKNVPILRMKDISTVMLETPDQQGVDRVDWAALSLKDKRLVDWNTPCLKDWVHDQLKMIRNVQKVGPWKNAWNTVAKQLNEKNKTNLEGKDVRVNLPYR